MKKKFLVACLALIVGMAGAQEKKRTGRDYLVHTSNVKSKADSGLADVADSTQARKVPDFVNDNFKYYSMCDWQRGMRFMVMPEKVDLITNTFCQSNGEEVSSVTLRHKIMRYEGHERNSRGSDIVKFTCEDSDPSFNGKSYYYEIPSGTFENYCMNKLGVPTLAYLGDVDIADSLLMGKKLYTTAKTYFIDTSTDGEGAQEVSIPGNLEVTVVAVGVGTRSFPVKIVVEDEDKNQFFQNVAISKTNSGMRDNEFIMDNVRHTFYGSFGLMDGRMAVSEKYSDYIGKNVFTKRSMKMLNEKSQKMQGVPRMTGFYIESIHPKNNSNYVTLRLKNNATAGYFQKDVTFINTDVTGDIDGKDEGYFGSLFAEGHGKQVETSIASRAMINVGHVGTGMTEDEVLQAVGEPERTEDLPEGRYKWYYSRSKGVTLVVEFGTNNTVVGTSTFKPGAKKGGRGSGKGGKNNKGGKKK